MKHYRPLKHGEEIQPSDEATLDSGVNWTGVGQGVIGTLYEKAYHFPMRRPTFSPLSLSPREKLMTFYADILLTMEHFKRRPLYIITHADGKTEAVLTPSLKGDAEWQLNKVYPSLPGLIKVHPGGYIERHDVTLHWTDTLLEFYTPMTGKLQ